MIEVGNCEDTKKTISFDIRDIISDYKDAYFTFQFVSEVNCTHLCVLMWNLDKLIIIDL